MSDRTELAAKIVAAGSSAERAAIFYAAGVAVPTYGDVNSAYANLSDFSGSGASATTIGVAVGQAAANAAS